MKEDIIPEGYVRVSTILSIFQAYSFVDPAKLKKAQDTGTEIHAAIESFYLSEFEPVSFRRIPYVESFLKWQMAYDPDVLCFEKRFFGLSMKVTGRIDLLAKINGHTVLVDFKTGSWAHPEVWQLQGTFYRLLLEESGEANLPDEFLFVQLMKDGSEPLLHRFKHNISNVDVCKAAYRCWQYFKP